MLFAITMIDRPHSAELRAATAAAHREFVGRHADRIRIGGPLLSDDGDDMIGSLVVADFADRQAAYDFMADEPYTRAGLFEMITIRRFGPVVENPDVGQD